MLFTAKPDTRSHPDQPLTRLASILFHPFKAMKARKAKEDADVAYLAARNRYLAACDAGDTRRMHETWPEFFRTQSERLKLEVGR